MTTTSLTRWLTGYLYTPLCHAGRSAYGYHPNLIRVRETNDGTTTRFLHAGEDIVASYQGGAVDTYYTHGPGIDEPRAQVDPDAAADEQLAYLHRDGLGSVTAISNPNAQLRGAGRLTRPGGALTLTMRPNPAAKSQVLHFLGAFGVAA